MYEAYIQFLDIIKQAFSTLKEVVGSAAADEFDADLLLSNNEDLVSVFDYTKAQTSRSIIAEKEMYDFVVAHKVIPYTFNKARADWYIDANLLLDRELLELERQRNIFAILLDVVEDEAEAEAEE